MLRVRRAVGADAPALRDLAARSFVAAFGDDNDPDQIRRYVAEAFSRERIAEELVADGSMVLVLDEDAAASSAGPRGYARLLRCDSGHVDAEYPVRLVRLYVEPALIGRGWGGVLMAACLQAAAGELGCDTMWLGVWERNLAAQRFYTRWGFEIVGDHVFHLGAERQRDLVMARRVGPSSPARSSSSGMC